VRGLAVWAILKEIGADGMRDRVRRHLDSARRVAELAHEHAELEVLAEPVLSICCFRYRPKGATADRDLDAINEQIVKAVRARAVHAIEHDRRRALRDPPLLYQRSHDARGCRGARRWTRALSELS